MRHLRGLWGYVYAVDVATGKEHQWPLPTRSPTTSRGRHPCCVIWSIGAWAWGYRISMWPPSMGGCIALDAATGKKIWEVDTITDHKLPYSSSGAPQSQATS